ncbi:sodium- and chloride-dependent taurine transporter-like [Plectropomus leopardus]|uniref:sodium- and chloride-dependent taurine transporter-like n=1 Tax=Plectropomus leopardus TaxID=160734 RepID=UPI001C4A8290|nr:sodium- and chloride-dependent taurine transporter-like [Plectropomus leopardus]
MFVHRSITLFLCLSFKVCFICSFLEYQPLTSGSYVYPDWAYCLGWAMVFSSVVAVPIWAVSKVCLTEGTLRQRLLVLWHPVLDSVGPKSNNEDPLNEVEMKPMTEQSV